MPARRTTSTPTPRPPRLRVRCAPRSWCTSPTSPACTRTIPTRRRSSRRSTSPAWSASSRPARAPARVLHPRGHRHHGHERGHVMTEHSLSLAEITALDAENVMQTYGRAPVAFVRGEGTVLYDSAGTRYLDFLSGLAVPSLGHAHPAVADAIAEQARTLLHVSNLYYNEVQPQVAEILNRLLGGGGRV